MKRGYPNYGKATLLHRYLDQGKAAALPHRRCQLFVAIFITLFLQPERAVHAAEGISTNQPSVNQTADGEYEMGEIKINREERSITFPGLVNMDEDVIEYALVHESGKVHESLLSTRIQPKDIQVALLLVSPRNPYETEEGNPTERLKFDVFVQVLPDETMVRIEDWITNAEKKQTMSHGGWDFIGSIIREGNFVAQNEGSIISVIADSASIIENPREGRDNDDIWQVNKGVVPKKDTVVETTIKFVDKEAAP